MTPITSPTVRPAVSAASDEDYDNHPTVIPFDSCQMISCVSVPATDDTEVENPESFTVTITTDMPSKIRLRQPTATIIIYDDDCEEYLI